jgi:hypothetical protein
MERRVNNATDAADGQKRTNRVSGLSLRKDGQRGRKQDE